MIFEILLFLYTLIVIPFHKLKDAWKRYFICNISVTRNASPERRDQYGRGSSATLGLRSPNGLTCSSVTSNDEYLVIHIGNFTFNTDYKKGQLGKGFPFNGEWYSDDPECHSKPLQIDEDF